MATRTIETKVYTIDVHPHPDKVFDWIRNNWFDLHDFDGRELVNSLKWIAKELGCEVDYCISAYPDRSDFISFEEFQAEDLEAFRRENEKRFDHWHYVIVEALANETPEDILHDFYNQCECLYSGENLEDLCFINGYEFEEDGSFYC